MAKDITSARNLTGLKGDVRRTNNFILSIPEITDDTDLELVVQKAFLPKVSLNVLELRHGNDAKKFAGVATWEGGQITILDTLSTVELDAVLAWFKETYNWDIGDIGVAETDVVGEGYKKAGTIREYAANGEYVRQWEFTGLWISELDLGQLDASQGEMKEITFTIQIDPGTLTPTYEGYPQ